MILTFPALAALLALQSAASQPREREHLQARFSVTTGPAVHTSGDRVVLDDFRFDGAELRWMPDAVVETMPPIGGQSAEGIRIAATALDSAGRAVRITLAAQGDLLTFDLAGLPSNSTLALGARIRADGASVRMRSGLAMSYEPAILHVAVGDPDAGSNVLYTPAFDRAILALPLGLGSIGRTQADGSRRVEWRVPTGPTGDLAGLSLELRSNASANESGMPKGSIRQVTRSTAASGWRTGPIYGDQITDAAMAKELPAIAKKLAPFGLEYVQIDGGWQNPPPGIGSKPASAPRPWEAPPSVFASGLTSQIRAIRELGLKAAVALVPQTSGESATAGAVGEAALPAELGAVLWNGVAPEFAAQLERYVKPLAAAGADRFVLECQPTIYEAYENAEKQRTDFSAKESFVASIDAFRKAVGATAGLVCGWYGATEPPAPRPVGAGLDRFDSLRLRRPADPNRAGFADAAETIGLVCRWNGLSFHGDPEAIRVGGKLTLDQARAWASLASLSGVELFIGDRVAELPEERIEVLRRVLPTIPARTFYCPQEMTAPRVVKLWKDHGTETSLVAGYFGVDEAPATIQQDPLDPVYGRLLGAEKFEFWSGRFIGRAPAHSFDAPLAVPPGACAVVAYREARETPFVISTSRHVSQGAADLKAERWDSAASVLSGESAVVGGDPYEIRVVLPHRGWKLVDATASDVKCESSQEGRLARIRIRSERTRSVFWRVKLEEGKSEAAAPLAIEEPQFDVKPGPVVRLRWKCAGSPAGSFLMKRDGQVLASCVGAEFYDAGILYNSSYEYEIVPVDDEGHEHSPVKIQVKTHQPQSVPLTTLPHSTKRMHSTTVRVNENFLQKPLTSQGKVITSGFGLLSPAFLDFSLRGLHGVFRADACIDDIAEKLGSAQIRIEVDDRVVARTPVFRGGDPPVPIRARIPQGAKSLSVIVESAEDGQDYDFVDLLNPEIRAPRQGGASQPKK